MMLDPVSDSRVALPGPLDAVARNIDRRDTAHTFPNSKILLRCYMHACMSVLSGRWMQRPLHGRP